MSESRPAKSIFTEENEAFLRGQEVGKPTGVILKLGDIEFDLHPLSVSEGEAVLSLIDKFAELQAMASEGAINESAIKGVLKEDMPKALNLMRSVLHTAAYVAPEDEARFNAWFERIPLVSTLQLMRVAVAQANGFGAMVNPPTPAVTPGPTPLRPRKKKSP